MGSLWYTDTSPTDSSPTDSSPTDSSPTGQFADRTVRRQYSLPIGQFADRTVHRQDNSPTGQFADSTIDPLNLQDSMQRLPCAELGSELGCCGNLKLIYYVSYAAQNNDLGQFLGVFEVNYYDGTNYKPEKKNFERCTVHRGTM